MRLDDFGGRVGGRVGDAGTLVLVRHGETAYSRERRFTGAMDIPLTANGTRQACEAGRVLVANRMQNFDRIYCSPMKRAQETAYWLLQCSDSRLQTIRTTSALAEGSVGVLTGMVKGSPEANAYPYDYDRAPPGGESDADIERRVRHFIETELAPLFASGKRVLIVAHSGILQAILTVLGVLGKPTSDGNSMRARDQIAPAVPLAFLIYQDGAAP